MVPSGDLTMFFLRFCATIVGDRPNNMMKKVKIFRKSIRFIFIDTILRLYIYKNKLLKLSQQKNDVADL
jgi:hypothetical protein